MKKFRCGDLVPGCTMTFAGTEDQVLAAVATHAQADHGMAHVSEALARQVRGALTSVD